MNLKNVNYAMYDSSCILQHIDLKLVSVTFSANIFVQKKPPPKCNFIYSTCYYGS